MPTFVRCTVKRMQASRTGGEFLQWMDLHMPSRVSRAHMGIPGIPGIPGRRPDILGIR